MNLSKTIGQENMFDMAACLALVRQEDESAARRLVDHLHPLVIRLVRGHLPRRAAEEDLAQDIFVRIFTKLNQYNGTVPFEHWVSRIAVNHCLNAIRAQKSRPEWRMADLTEEEAAALEATSSATAQEPHPAYAQDDRELVEKLLAMLTPADRLILRLVDMEQRPIREVQQLTGWTSTRIRVRAFRARKKLNQQGKRITFL